MRTTNLGFSEIQMELFRSEMNQLRKPRTEDFGGCGKDKNDTEEKRRSFFSEKFSFRCGFGELNTCEQRNMPKIDSQQCFWK